jgi:5-formyltetrahydrofolate cyclo-ligase
VTKAELRREMRTRLTSLGPERGKKSRAIAAAIAMHPRVAAHPRLALFSPLPTEPDVEELWQGKPGPFCYPRMAPGGIEFVDVEKIEDLAISGWHPHIREHSLANAPVVMPVEIGIILVPGLAFTRKGDRLGRGGGFYDRYLAQLPSTTFKLGVCFAMQLVPTLPTEPHDQCMDAVVTENGFLR